MATTGHESEAINVQGLKASLQKFKTDHIDGAAYLEDDDSSAVIADFDPQADTVWKKQQVLSAAEKAQVRENISVYGKSETYSKTEVNELVSSPHQNYVTVAAYADLANIANPSDDTIYRVSSYDGENSQVDVTKYSEYAWTGSEFRFLCVKSQIGEVFDISAYHAGTEYDDLADALGTNGANVPAELRQPGMSVKFVESTDHKYVQFRCMPDEFTTDVTKWQGEDNVPTQGSKNLVQSGGVDKALNNIAIDKTFEIVYPNWKYDIIADFKAGQQVLFDVQSVNKDGSGSFAVSLVQGSTIVSIKYGVGKGVYTLPSDSDNIRVKIDVSGTINSLEVGVNIKSGIALDNYLNTPDDTPSVLSEKPVKGKGVIDFASLQKGVMPLYKLVCRQDCPNAGLQNGNGTIDTSQSVSGYKYSNYIKVSKTSILHCKNVMPAGYGGVVLFDANKQFLRNLSPSTAENEFTVNLYSYLSSDYGYIRICPRNDNNTPFVKICSFDDEIHDYNAKEMYEANLYGALKTDGTIGFISSGTTAIRTGLIRVMPGEIYIFNGYSNEYSTYPAVMGYTDENRSTPTIILQNPPVKSEVAFKVPANIKFIEAWGKRNQTDYEHHCIPCYIKRNHGNTTVIVSKSGSKNVSSTSLLEGIMIGTSTDNNTVIVKEGTYDLIQEFKDYYGNNFFDNFTSSQPSHVYLYNNVKIIFSKGAKVVCNYTGSNDNVKTFFSPFGSAVNPGGFTLDGLTLECKNTRYAIHDDPSSKATEYKNIYKNCNIKSDNTENTAWTNSAVIGAGLGKFGIIEIENCIFDNTYTNEPVAVSYHNNVEMEGSIGYITIKDCYFKNKGTVQVINTGSLQSSKYNVIVTNNSLGSNINVTGTAGQNATVYEWNNIVRS